MRRSAALALCLLACELPGCAKAQPSSFAPLGFSASAQNTSLQQLQQDITAATTGPGVQRGTWGIVVESLDRGDRLFELNARRLLVPASVAKLVSLATAVDAVGWDYRYETTLVATGPIVDGVLQGDLLIVGSDPNHPITERFATLTVYPLARSIELVAGGVNGHQAQAIVQTSQRSWAESDLATLTSEKGVAMEPEKGDKAGPVTIGAASSAPAEAPAPAAGQPAPAADAPKPETRVVVFGDSDFATNAYGGVSGNPNLFANAVNWLTQQENLIAIRPKSAQDRRVAMTARQQTMVFLTSLFLMPAIVFGAGIYTWWRRR